MIVSQESTVNNWLKGTLISGRDELDELIAAVYRVFRKYSREARDKALTVVSKMNPYVHEETSGGMTVYRAERGKPVLIPLQKFIAQ
ncbi:MAG: hypothetical protein JXA55_01245 [Bacteroidales bacterium]|nr:hypothetical protein [Bacteroidales bacterium]